MALTALCAGWLRLGCSAKAAEIKFLLAVNERSPQETRELRNLEQTYTTLAENEEWMANNSDKTLQR